MSEVLPTTISLGSYITPVGLRELPTTMTLEHAAVLWEGVWTLHEASPWALGDLFCFLQDRFGEQASQLYDTCDVSKRKRMHTARNNAAVCRKFPHSRRREGSPLSYSHFEAVAALDTVRQDHWLDQAIDQDMSVDRLRRAVKEAKGVPDVGNGKSKTINVPESRAERDQDAPVMDAGQGFGDARRNAVDAVPVAETDTLSDLFSCQLQAIAKLPAAPVLARDLAREKFDDIHLLDAVITKLNTVRSALFKQTSTAGERPLRPTARPSAPAVDQGETTVPQEPVSPAPIQAASNEMPPIPSFLDRRGRH